MKRISSVVARTAGPLLVGTLSLAGIIGNAHAQACDTACKALRADVLTPFELWTFDQSRSDFTDADGDGYYNEGGFLYVFKGRPFGGIKLHPTKIDLAALLVANGQPVGERPHIGGTNVSKTHAHVSWFGRAIGSAQGGVSIFNLRSKKPVFTDLNKGQLHMPGPSPDELKMAGPAPGDQKLYMWNTDYRNDVYTLASTTDLSPAAMPALAAGLGTAKAQPVCTNFTPDSKHLAMTFADGGFAIFNVENPAQPVLTEVYSKDEFGVGTNAGEGCSLIQHPDGKRLYTGSGVSSPNDTFNGNREMIHVWNMQTFGNGVKDDHITQIDLQVGDGDGVLEPGESWGDNHGPNWVYDRYLWVVMRIDGTIKVIDSKSDTLVNTFPLATTLSNGTIITKNLAGDVLDPDPINPFIMYLSTRGYCPISGLVRFKDSAPGHACAAAATDVPSPGRTPGQMIMNVSLTGKSGKIVNYIPISNKTTTTVTATGAAGPDGVLNDIVDVHAGKVMVRSPFLPPQ